MDRVARVLTGVTLVVLAAFAGRASAAEELTPEKTIENYLAAVKKNEFTDAYKYVAKTMTQGKDEAAWAKEQQWVMQMSEAKIFDFKVYPGKIEKDRAYVPNILHSQDKYLNQLGVEEHEIYTLVREDGRWKIEQQQLIEPTDKEKWFPAGAESKPASDRGKATPANP